MENVNVTLYVNTAEINNQNISATCNFGQETGIKNEDYTIVVNVGDTIIWEGVSSSSENDIVGITKIKFEEGTKIFDKDVLEGTSTVVGTTIGTTDKDEKYKISFKVNGSSTYSIDPKIQINQ